MDIGIRAIYEYLKEETDLILEMVEIDSDHEKETIDINGGLRKHGKPGLSLGITDKGEVCVFHLKLTTINNNDGSIFPEVNLSIESEKINICGPNGLENLKNELLKLATSPNG